MFVVVHTFIRSSDVVQALITPFVILQAVFEVIVIAKVPAVVIKIVVGVVKVALPAII